jgi:iron complex outermembrane receptor protein
MVTLLGAGDAYAQDQGRVVASGASQNQLAQAPQDQQNAFGAVAVEEITVTARKREETAQSVPIALSVIGQKQLEATDDYDLSQFQQLTPSLQFTTFNPRNTNINIRGLGSNIAITNDGLDNGVGVYLDQVYLGRVGLTTFDLIDLDRVEVLRGPQGTLYGKNTTAGAINITTQGPSFTPEATAEISGGNYGYLQARASASGPIVDDKLAVRFSVGETKRDGFEQNILTGQHEDNYQDLSFRGQILATPVDSLRIRIIADYENYDAHCCIGVIDGVVTTYTNGAPIANNYLQQIARFPGYVPVTAPAFARVTNIDSPIYTNMNQLGVSGNIEWTKDNFAVTSITAYRQWNWYPSNDVDYTGLPVLTEARIIDHQQQWSQEFRIASTGQHTIDYVAGLYYFWQIINGVTTTSYGSAAPAWYLGTALPAALGNVALNGFATTGVSNPQTSSYAAFGQANWHINDKLTLTGGTRFTHEVREGSYSDVQSGQPLSLLPAAEQATAQALRNQFGAVESFSAHFANNSVSGLATLSYQVTPDVLTYATYSHGSQSGGLNFTLLPAALANPIVQPESVNNYELGVKSQFLDHRLTANLAPFWTDIGNYQTAIIGLTAPFPQAIANIPKVRSRGIDADISYSPLQNLSFTASGEYLDATYLDYTNGPCPVELGPTASFPFCNLSGRPLAGAPKWTVSLSADGSQSLPFKDLEAYFHVDYRHQSALFTAVSDSIYSRISPYGLTNLRIGVRTSDQRWDLSLWARNLFNVNYFNAVSMGTNGLITGNPGDPRTFGATLRAKF